MIGAALASFALPVDAIPEMVFLGLGFTDAATLRTMASHVTDDHPDKAEAWLSENG